jgi:hypothetical protein
MKNSQKLAQNYVCNYCDYTCSRKNDYAKHILTPKHKNRTNLNALEQKVAETPKNFVCKNCNKAYNARNSLWYHQKNCKTEDTYEHNVNENMYNGINDKKLILMLIKQNAELVKETSDFKSMMMKVLENGSHNNSHNTTTTNSHNKAFNLQFFLNETCKDAMNIMDFVESIKLQVSDLESVGELGYIEGISNIIVKNLNALDVTQRPVHCTDKKRETIYIKDDNKWEKDEEQKKMHKMIKKVADKNARLLPKFTEKYPDYKNYHSKNSDRYCKIIVESMGGSGDNDYEKEEKIIKNIAKNIIIEK